MIYLITMNMSKEEYLKLLQDLDGDVGSDLPVDSWFPSVSPAKEKMLKSKMFAGTTDCLELKREQILAAIKDNCNLKVGPFSIKVRGYYFSEKNEKPIMTIDIYERKSKTPTGHPCNMDYKLDVYSDKRFIGRPWLELFNNGRQGTATNVPIETVVDIIKWLQALKKLTVFL